MHCLKFGDLNLLSNRKSILKSKTIIFFYGLGCSSDILIYLKLEKIKYQLLIPELPGHNNTFYKKYDIEQIC